VFLCASDTEGYPLPLSDSSKTLLRMSVFNDTLFLSNLEIVDYSVIVGLDRVNQKLVVGIIGTLMHTIQGRCNGALAWGAQSDAFY
jgi:hypothetical protein